jgi:hypothetical protein
MGNTSAQKIDIKCDEHKKELIGMEPLDRGPYLVKAVLYNDLAVVMNEKEEEIHLWPMVT